MTDIALGRLAPVLAAHKASAIEVPTSVLDAISRASALSRTAEQTRIAADDAKRKADAAYFLVVDAMVEHGPGDHPFATIKEARERAADLREDAELLTLASDQAKQAVAPAFLAVALDLAHQLVDGLAAVLKQAKPHAPALASLDFDDPDAVHDAPPATAKAFHALEPLAKKHDAIRRAALALFADLSIGHTADVARRRAMLEALDDSAFRGGRRQEHGGWWIGQFAGGGLRGPAPQLRNRGEVPGWSSRWEWAPMGRHPVARLVDAALNSLPEPLALANDNVPPGNRSRMVEVRPASVGG